MIKFLLLTACVGHILCWQCDRLLIYTPDGRFQFAYMQDNEKMAKHFEHMPIRNALISMLLGLLALMMSFGGYVGLYEWMKQFSIPCARIIIASAALLFIPGAAHHVFCGVIEWFYIRLGRTENVRETVVEFFKKTSVTMYACYLGQAVFSVALFFMVVTGKTGIPQWCCIFNVLPIYLVLAPFRVAGAGNIAGAVMFLGLFLFL